MDVESAPPLYTYTPLDRPESIRILILYPSTNHTASLLCDIVHENRHEILLDLKQQRSYEAVSYVWGDPIFSDEIVLDHGSSRLAVTPNVDSLLRHLRKPVKARRLWIDAVCLNQSDNFEKAIQVGLMGEIYSQAMKVHVWLGDQIERMGQIQTRRLQNGDTANSRITALFRVLSATRASNSHMSLVGHLTPFVFLTENDMILLVQMFLQLPWFRRRWTIQEAALNHNTFVRYGHEKIPWGTMVDALLKLRAYYGSKLDNQAIDAIITATGIRSMSDNMLDLLLKHHKAQCIDLRDRIAALLSMATYNGLLRQISRETLQWIPDYTISWQDNYLSFCISVMNMDGGRGFRQILQHLQLFGHLAQSHESYPSWVPDWSCRRISRIRDIPFLGPPLPTPYYADCSAITISRAPVGVLLSTCISDYFHLEKMRFDVIQETDIYFLWLYVDYWELFSLSEHGRDELSYLASLLSELLQLVLDHPLSIKFEDFIGNSQDLSQYLDPQTLKFAVREWMQSSEQSQPTQSTKFIELLNAIFKFHSVFMSTNKDGYNYFGIAHSSEQTEITYRWPEQYDDIVADFDRRAILFSKTEMPNIKQATILRGVGFDGDGVLEGRSCRKVVGHCYYTSTRNYKHKDNSARRPDIDIYLI
ncbi:hypothetical protein VTL71DRAFT_16452 [Oculimacula yallundae]|uniref:Heterokaryon incompatibility domain-containing protein n=1 Tax=Oculimacula yallundae TaxID=86028 RepID=A0ABR4CEG8_9HELO